MLNGLNKIRKLRKLSLLWGISLGMTPLYTITPEEANGLGRFHYALAKKEPLSTVLEIFNKQLSDVNVGDFHGMTPLLIGALSGDPELLRYIISKGPHLYTVDFEGKNALMYVAGSKDIPDSVHAVESIKLLSVNNAYDNTAQALILAARAGYVNKVATLLEVIPVYAKGDLQALYNRLQALESTYKKITDRLSLAKKEIRVAATPYVDIKQVPGYTLKTDYVIENLGEMYRDVISSRIFTAATQAKLESLQSINAQDTWGMSALMIAAKAKNKEAFAFVVSKHPECRLYDTDGTTALTYAAGNIMNQGLLLADMIMAPIDSGLTHAELVRQKISVEMVQLLFNKLVPPIENADPFAHSLQAAIDAGFIDVVTLLLKHGFYTVDQLTALEAHIKLLLDNYKKIGPLLLKKISRTKAILS